MDLIESPLERFKREKDEKIKELKLQVQLEQILLDHPDADWDTIWTEFLRLRHGGEVPRRANYPKRP